MSKTVVPRTCIAFNKGLSSVFKALRESDGENGVWSDEQVVLDGGRRPVWKYCRTSFAVQREGDDQEVCYQDELVSSKISQTLQKKKIKYLHLLNLVAKPLNQESSLPFLLHWFLVLAKALLRSVFEGSWYKTYLAKGVTGSNVVEMNNAG